MSNQRERKMDGKYVMKGVLQNFMVYLNNQQNNNSKEIARVKSPHQLVSLKGSTVSSSSTVSSYLNYRKQMNNNLTEINTNISQMLIDTFKGIDSICTRVRECVSDFNSRRLKINPETKQTKKTKETKREQSDRNSVEDETSTENILESIHDELETTIKKSNEFPNSEPATPSDSGSAYVIESLVALETSKEQEPDILKPEISKDDPKTRLPAFITVVGDGSVKTDKAETQITPSPNTKRKRKSKQVNKRNTLLDLKNSLTLDVDNTGICSLQTLIENVTQEIDILCTQSVENAQKQKSSTEKVDDFKTIKTSEEDSLLPSNLHSTEAKPQCPLQKPEVYNRPGVTNIHKRLIHQLEANDSFAAFQKLMRKNKDQKNFICKSPVSRINIPILSNTPSISSRNRSNKSEQSKSSIKSSRRKIKEDECNRKSRVKYSDSLWFTEKKRHKGERGHKKSRHHEKDKRKVGPIFSLTSKSKPIRKSTSNVTQKSPKSNTGCTCAVTVSNERPVPNNNRLYLNSFRVGNRISRKLAHVDILDDLTNKDLLPLHAEYPRKDHLHVNETFKDVHDSYLYKIMYGSKDKNINNSILNQLLHPTIKDNEKHKRKHDKYHDKLPIEMKMLNKTSRPSSADKSTGVKSRRKQAIQALAPYLFDPQLDHRKIQQPLIVMQVHVFYENNQNITMEYPRNLNYNHKLTTVQRPLPTVVLPLTPMKEVQVNRGKWTNAASRKKQSNKLESPTSSSIHSSVKKSMGTKLSARTTRKERKEWSRKYDGLSKNENHPTDQKALKDFVGTSPSSNKKSIQLMDKLIIQSVNVDQNLKKSPHTVKSLAFSPRKPNNLQNDVDSQSKLSYRSNKTENNKGQQLITSSLKQSKNLDRNDSDSENRWGATITSTKHSNPIKNLKTSKTGKSSLPNSSYPVAHDLNKNDPIQNNIQKAISVVETKMVDMFSSGVFANVDALDVMQKEITSVLDSMKFSDGNEYKNVTPLSTVKELSADNSKFEDDKGVSFDIPEREQPPGDLLQEKPLQISNTEPSSDKSKHEHFVNAFDAISSDVFRKLENILDPDMDNEISMTNIDNIGKRKQGSKRQAEKLQSTSDITLSSDDNHKHHKKYRTRENSPRPKMSPKTVQVSQKKKNKPGTVKVTNKKHMPIRQMSNVSSSPYLIESQIQSCISLTNSQELEKITLNSKNFQLSNKSEFRDIPVLDTRKRGKDFQEDLKEIIATIPINTEQQIDEVTTTQSEHFENLVKNHKLSDDKKILRDLAYNIETKPSIEYSKEETENNFIYNADENPTKERQEEQNYKDNVHPKPITESKVEQENANEIPSKENNVQEEKKDVYDYLEDQVNKIISRVEDIYSQLDEMQSPGGEISPTVVPIFRDISPRIKAIPSEEFLTPFMHALKHSRSKTKTTDPISAPILERSPSYYNVLNFLSTLSDIQLEKPVEIHKAILVNYAYSVSICTTVHFANLKHCVSLSYSKNILGKPSCLKKCTQEKSKVKSKKVSFLVTNQLSNYPVPKINIDNNKSEVQSQLHQGRNLNSEDKKVMVICDEFKRSDASTEINVVKGEMLQLTELNPSGNKSTQIDGTETIHVTDTMITVTDEISEGTSDLSFMSAQGKPAIKVFYNEPYKLPTALQHNVHLDKHAKTYTPWIGGTAHDLIQKIVIFREVSDVGDMLGCTKKFKKSLTNNPIVLKREVYNDGSNVLLKSFYAIMYLLVFTALNMEYKCH